MNEPLFELISDEYGTVRRPAAPNPDWTPVLAELLARWKGRRARLARVPADDGSTLSAVPAQAAQ